MPFKSKAQMGAAFGGHLGPEMEKKAHQWAKETPNIKKLPKHVKKEEINERTYEFANNLKFFVVEKPHKYAKKASDIVFPSTPFGFAKQFIAGLVPEEVYGFYLSEDEANSVAESLIKDAMDAAKALEEKKDVVLEKLNKTINKLQKEINLHMKGASQNPEEADKHHMMAEKKMQMIKAMRDKHKMVEAAKKELPKKDEK